MIGKLQINFIVTLKNLQLFIIYNKNIHRSRLIKKTLSLILIYQETEK